MSTLSPPSAGVKFWIDDQHTLAVIKKNTGGGDTPTTRLLTMAAAWQPYRDELGKQAALAWPISVGMLLMRSFSVMSMIFVGQFCSSTDFAAVSIASVLANVTGHSVMVGLSSGLATLASQAYGAGDLRTMNRVFFKALVLLLGVCVPLSILWQWTTAFFVACGQDATVSKEAGRYMQALVPSLWMYALLQCVTTWLQAQGITRPIAVTSGAAALLHPLLNWLFIRPCGLGAIGSAVATALTQAIWLAMLIVYICWYGVAAQTGLVWPSRKELRQTLRHDPWPFLQLSFGGLLMMGEWWATESIVFLAGFLPDPTPKIGAMAIYQTMNALAYMVDFGAHVAANVRVGNELGRGQAVEAKRASRVAPIYAGMISAIMGLCLFLLRDYYPRIFTANARERQLVRTTAHVAALYMFADGIQAAATGVLKGSGKQTVAYVATLVSYFGVGLPLSILFAFRFEWDILGLCLGLAAGCFCYLLSTTALVASLKWDIEVNRARDRRLGEQQHPSLRTFGSWSGALPTSLAEGKGRVEEREDHLPVLRLEDYYQEEKGKVEESKEVDVEVPSQSHASNGIEKEKRVEFCKLDVCGDYTGKEEKR